MNPVAPEERPYTNEELRGSPPDWPTRGILCPKCRAVIPQFAALTSSELARLHGLITMGQRTMAMQELQFLTGAPERWAKIWVVHGGRANVVDTTAPCPFCSKPLKTARAKQCPHCHMDWHNSAKPVPLRRIAL